MIAWDDKGNVYDSKGKQMNYDPSQAAMQNSQHAYKAQHNEGPSTAALVWGLVSLFFNLFYVPGIVAIVLGHKALDRRYSDGRTAAGWGFGLGIFSTVASVIVTIIIIGAIAGS